MINQTGKTMVITLEEHVLVKDFVLLPVVLDTLELDIKRMLAANLKMLPVYICNLRALQEAIIQELTEVKREFRQRGIKVFNLKISSSGLAAEYLCRGYQFTFSMLPPQIRSFVIVKLCGLMGLDVATLKK